MADQQVTEEWRPIPGFPGYEASSLGRIRSVAQANASRRPRTGKVLNQKPTKSGYLTAAVGSMSDGTRYPKARVNRLVCATFHGPAPSPEHHAAHGDGDRTNNRADNLRWVTDVENKADMARHGTLRMGVAIHHKAKLTEVDVASIRAALRENVPSMDLAKQYGVTHCNIRFIARGVTWKHVL